MDLMKSVVRHAPWALLCAGVWLGPAALAQQPQPYGAPVGADLARRAAVAAIGEEHGAASLGGGRRPRPAVP